MLIRPIIEATQHAAHFCNALQAHIQGMDKFNADKGASEPVTVADYGAQAILGRAIAQHFPNDAVISEESAAAFLSLTTPAQRQHIADLLQADVEQLPAWLDVGRDVQAARTWIIDPIDGTKGFIAGRHYAIGIAIIEDGTLVGAVMGCPRYGAQGALFYTYRGGLFRHDLGAEAPLAVPPAPLTGSTPVRVMLSIEDEPRQGAGVRELLAQAGLEAHIATLDSMEKYAHVASGEADLIIRMPNDNPRPNMVWDYAPGAALVLAAGGQMTSLTGAALDFSQAALPNGGFLISRDPAHHAAIVAAFQQQGGA